MYKYVNRSRKQNEDSTYNLRIPLKICCFHLQYADSAFSCGFCNSSIYLYTCLNFCVWIPLTVLDSAHTIAAFPKSHIFAAILTIMSYFFWDQHKIASKTSKKCLFTSSKCVRKWKIKFASAKEAQKKHNWGSLILNEKVWKPFSVSSDCAKTGLIQKENGGKRHNCQLGQREKEKGYQNLCKRDS